jgi:hypothetical protein
MISLVSRSWPRSWPYRQLVVCGGYGCAEGSTAPKRDGFTEVFAYMRGQDGAISSSDDWYTLGVVFIRVIHINALRIWTNRPAMYLQHDVNMVFEIINK